MTPKPLPDYLTVGQLAEKLQLSKRTLTRLVSLGQFPPPLRIGRSLRWDPRALSRWAKAYSDGENASNEQESVDP